MTDYEIQIDELKICYVADIVNLMNFKAVEAGCFIDCLGYRFHRIINDRFRFFFDIMLDGEQVAQMKFGLYTDLNDKVVYVYFKVANAVLYDRDRFTEVLELPTLLNLVFNNFTAIDLACDSTQNFPSLIKKMMRDKEVTTIINGKAVHDRKALVQGVTFDYSTTLNRLVHPTVTIRQKKAITNKCDGITVQAYDKKAEIENKSFAVFQRRNCHISIKDNTKTLSQYMSLIAQCYKCSQKFQYSLNYVCFLVMVTFLPFLLESLFLKILKEIMLRNVMISRR